MENQTLFKVLKCGDIRRGNFVWFNAEAGGQAEPSTEDLLRRSLSGQDLQAAEKADPIKGSISAERPEKGATEIKPEEPAEMADKALVQANDNIDAGMRKLGAFAVGPSSSLRVPATKTEADQNGEHIAESGLGRIALYLRQLLQDLEKRVPDAQKPAIRKELDNALTSLQEPPVAGTPDVDAYWKSKKENIIMATHVFYFRTLDGLAKQPTPTPAAPAETQPTEPTQRTEELIAGKMNQLKGTTAYVLHENEKEIDHIADLGFKTVERYILARMDDVLGKVPDTSKAYVKLNFTNILKSADLENLANTNGEAYKPAAIKAIKDSNALYQDYVKKPTPTPAETQPAAPLVAAAEVVKSGDKYRDAWTNKPEVTSDKLTTGDYLVSTTDSRLNVRDETSGAVLPSKLATGTPVKVVDGAQYAVAGETFVKISYGKDNEQKGYVAKSYLKPKGGNEASNLVASA